METKSGIIFRSILRLLSGLFIAAITQSLFAATGDYAGHITQARLFSQPLTWVGTNQPTADESEELWELLGLDPSGKSIDPLAGAETFLATHGNSPWAPSLEANLARYYRTQGHYDKALNYWQKAWTATKDLSEPKGRQVADFTVAYWSELLSSLGRMDELSQIVATMNDRPLSNPDFQHRFDTAKRALAIMEKQPGASFRCGSFALFNVASVLNIHTNLRPLIEMDSPASGFSLSQLMDLSRQYQLGLIAVKRSSGSELVVPSVVHWKETHYAAITEKQNGSYKVIDPTFGKPQWLSAKAINENASGYFMVPTNLIPAHWSLVSKTEAQSIFGKGLENAGDPSSPPNTCDANGNPCNTGCTYPCPPGASGTGGNGNGTSGSGGKGGCGRGGGCSESHGMPDWEVQEPYISLWLHDKPMAYNMSFGRQFELQVDYHQRETRPYDAAIFNLGPNWNCNLLTYIAINGSVTHSWEDDSQTNCHWDYDTETQVCNVVVDVAPTTSGSFQASEYCPDGGETDFSWNDPNYSDLIDPRSHVQFVPFVDRVHSGTVIYQGNSYEITNVYYDSNELRYPNGSVATFNEVLTVSEYPEEKIALITSASDPQGHTMQYFYSTNYNQVLLTKIVDFDGKTNLFIYGNTNYPTSITQVTNIAYGLAVNFRYDQNGFLTNVTDVMGISSSFRYIYTNDLYYTAYDDDGNPVDPTSNPVWLLTAMTTPYGTTSFDYFHPTWPLFGETPDSNINRGLTVTQPDGGKHLFVYQDYGWADVMAGPYPGVCGTGDAAAQKAIFDSQTGNIELQYGNSYYWGPRQYAALPSTNWSATYNYHISRVRSWLHENPDTGVATTPTLNVEKSFSGLTTWYGYEGKIAIDYDSAGMESTNNDLPTAIGYSTSFNWDGYGDEQINHFENTAYNSLGHPVSQVAFGNGTSCTTFCKTNRYIYYANGVDLLEHIQPDGVVAESYVYDGNHNVIAFTNALNEVTYYTYNLIGEVTSITQPNGLLTTNVYGTDGFLAQQIVIGISTNSYTYTNGLVWTHTDERGLTTTNTWDKLQRLTKVSYPDGTSVFYTYNNLDMVRVIDRMGFTNAYLYDNMRRKTAETNANGGVTIYSYCTCGALESIMNPAGNMTSFYYDTDGFLTNTTYADGYSISRAYDTYGLPRIIYDGIFASTYNYYDGEMRLFAVSNAVGRLSCRAYDIDGRVTNSVDANGVSVGMTYDNLNRMLTRDYPDGGVEKWGYMTNVSGPASYTNQIGDVTLYGYDALQRKTNEIVVGITTNKFAYNGAGDLLALTDGKNQATKWGYDAFGRVTNKMDAANNTIFVYKYDADNRLTNRWTPAKGNTGYAYDPMGNLKNIIYQHSPSISLSYDAVNRLTNMVDAVGTTAYRYDAIGQMLSEDGPWTDDTVSYSYTNRMRGNMMIASPVGTAWTNSYGYDPLKRLRTVVSPAGTFQYNYADDGNLHKGYYDAVIVHPFSADALPGNLVWKLLLPNGAWITNSFDGNARLLATELDNSGDTNLDSYAYDYNAANQRTDVTRVDGSYVDYTYDNEGELTWAKGKEMGGTTNRLQEQFGYNYDAAGNLNLRTNNALVQQFNVNNLNELSTITRGGTLTVAGETTPVAVGVTVNSQIAALYGDWTFAKDGFPLVNGTTNFSAVASDSYGRHVTNTVSVNLAATNNFVYDANGNLLSDGNCGYDWDDENELIRVTQTNSWKKEYVYDGKMRMRLRKEFAWSGSSWTETNEIRYLWDNDVIVQTRDTNNLPVLTFTRGNDLSGSLQKAGGIGGLLAMTENGKLNNGDLAANSYYHADGNGNITMMINTNQVPVAKYLYNPFGKPLAWNGTNALVNPIWFSSQIYDGDTGILHYKYRLYFVELDRWSNRDPLGETGFEVLRYGNSYLLPLMPILERMGGSDLYEFLNNQPTDYRDYFGLITPECETAIAIAAVAESIYEMNPKPENEQAYLDAVKKADDICNGPPLLPPIPTPSPCPPKSPIIPPPDAKKVCTSVTIGVVVYWVCSEGSRLFPPRNLVPVP